MSGVVRVKSNLTSGCNAERRAEMVLVMQVLKELCVIVCVLWQAPLKNLELSVPVATVLYSQKDDKVRPRQFV
jgi:hypothetical protein